MRNIPKELRFPLSGIGHDINYRDATLPTEERTYATPIAKNVIGSCAFSDRLRGGSRPGMKLATGVTSSEDGIWLWPNGEVIQWPDGKNVSFDVFGDYVTMPNGSRVIFQHGTRTFYRDRVIKSEGSLWIASRTGSYSDFNVGSDKDDMTRPVAGNISLAGRIGENISAFAPVNDAVLFIATKRSIWMMSGEPTNALKQISDNIGIVSANAWCFDGVYVYFIGANGLYAMVPGEIPILLSGKLPFDMKGLSSATLVYDPDKRAIHIFSTNDWFYDIENKAFWPIEYPSSIRPIAGGVAMIDGVNKVLFYGTDSNWYYWDDDTTKDAGTHTINSVVAIGPFRCGLRDDNDGLLADLTATLARDSSDVSMSVYTANDAEGAVRAVDAVGSSVVTQTISSGWNPVIRPRKRGSWAIIVLRGTGKWAYESMLATIRTLGRVRP